MNEITIILKDNSNKINLRIDKNLLVSKIDYFKGLLTKGFKESNNKEIVLEVQDAIQCTNIIMSLTNNKIETILSSVKCLDYWGIEFDYKELADIELEEKDFSKL